MAEGMDPGVLVEYLLTELDELMDLLMRWQQHGYRPVAFLAANRARGATLVEILSLLTRQAESEIREEALARWEIREADDPLRVVASFGKANE